MKFIRKNGRIIPIREKKQDYAATAKIGVAAGVAGAVGGALTKIGTAKNNKGFAIAGGLAAATGFSLGVLGSVKSVIRGVNAKDGEGVKVWGGHFLSAMGGQLVGGLAAAGAGALGAVAAYGVIRSKGKLATLAKLKKRSHLKVIK